MDVGRLECALGQCVESAEDDGEQVCAGDDDRGVDKGVLELGILADQLGLEEVDILDIAEKSGVDVVVRGDVLYLEGFERHCDCDDCVCVSGGGGGGDGWCRRNAPDWIPKF